MQKILKYNKLCLLLSLCVSSLMSCSKSDHYSDVKSKGDSVTTLSEPSQKNTLRVDVGSEVPSLDPTIGEDNVSSRITYDLFAGLVDFDQSNNFLPGMASSWDIEEDGKKYIFHLRDDLKFSDGTPINAQSFVYSWRRLVDPKTASPYNYLLDTLVNAKAIMAGQVPVESLGIKAINDTTLEVTLAVPDPAFIAKCAFPNAVVVPEHVIKKFGAKWTDPDNIVTSGAYILREHVVNGYILVQKNSNYYKANEVKIPYVKYFPYVDTASSLASFKSDGLDTTFTNVPVDQYKQLKQQYIKEMNTVKWEAISYYDFNMQLPEFKNNKKLRQALSMAIDRNAIANDVLGAGQTSLYSPVTPTIEHGQYSDVAYDWMNWSRDKQIAEAKKLYAEAGYSISNPLKVTIEYNTNDMNKKVALAVAAMWNSVLGVQSNVQNQEWKTFLLARRKGNYQIARDGFVGDYDSVTTYAQIYLCNSSQNNSHYCNLEYDKLYNQAINELDPAKQTALFKQALTLLLNDYPIMPIFQNAYQRLINQRVNGFDLSKNYLDHVQSKWATLSN